MNAKQAIARLCNLQSKVCEFLDYQHPADCFCGDTENGGLNVSVAHYRNDGVAIEFIEAAVAVAIAEAKGEHVRGGGV